MVLGLQMLVLLLGNIFFSVMNLETKVTEDILGRGCDLLGVGG